MRHHHPEQETPQKSYRLTGYAIEEYTARHITDVDPNPVASCDVAGTVSWWKYASIILCMLFNTQCISCPRGK